MTGREFKNARISRLKIGQTELATLMQTPRRTIQDIEATGDHEIMGIYAVCICLLIERDRWIMQGITDKVAADIARQFPGGIPSERDMEDE